MSLSSTPSYPVLTKLDLLEAPFWLAEQLVLSYLNKQTEQSSIQRVEELGERIRATFSKRVMKLDEIVADQVAPCLHDGLFYFYQKLSSIVPFSALEQISRYRIIWPANVVIDWDQLTDYFLSWSKDLKKLSVTAFPTSVIDAYIRLEFVVTCQALVRADLAYDPDLVRKGMERVMDKIQGDINRQMQEDWKQDYRPPLKTSLLELKARTSFTKLMAYNAQSFGISDDYKERLAGVIDDKVSAEIWQKVLKQYEIRLEALSTWIDWQEAVGSSEIGVPPPAVIVPLLRIIIVNQKQVEAIIQALRPLVKEEQHTSLDWLLSDKNIDEPIIVDCPQKSLAYLFRQAKEANHIKNDKTEIANWLVHWFRIRSKSETKELNYRTVYDALTLHNYTPKTKRILYKP